MLAGVTAMDITELTRLGGGGGGGIIVPGTTDDAAGKGTGGHDARHGQGALSANPNIRRNVNDTKPGL